MCRFRPRTSTPFPPNCPTPRLPLRHTRHEFALGPHDVPAFDVLMLGMGADGHTASLFPGSSAVGEQQRLVVAPFVASLGVHRISMTPPVLCGAASTIMLVTGTQKAAALQAVLEGPIDVARYPAQCLRFSTHRVTWLLDSDAAARLSI
jgi:6-phosphogluconolactonase